MLFPTCNHQCGCESKDTGMWRNALRVVNRMYSHFWSVCSLQFRIFLLHSLCRDKKNFTTKLSANDVWWGFTRTKKKSDPTAFTKTVHKQGHTQKIETTGYYGSTTQYYTADKYHIQNVFAITFSSKFATVINKHPTTSTLQNVWYL